MVVNTDTIVDPLAVMIKTFNTLVAYVTVPRVSCADNFTVWTKQICFEFLNHAHKWDLRFSLHVPGFGKDCQSKENGGSEQYCED